jgi:hypothetical protein
LRKLRRGGRAHRRSKPVGTDEAYQEARLAEHHAVVQRKPLRTAREGVRLAAIEYESALDDFTKFTVKRSA